LFQLTATCCRRYDEPFCNLLAVANELLTAHLSMTVAVLMSRFPSVTETFILREMIEMERQAQPVRLVPMLKESPPVIHDAAKPWTERALYTPFFNAAILNANVRTLLRSPARYLGLLMRVVAGTMTAPVSRHATLPAL